MPQIQAASIQNYELMCGMLFLAVLSLMMFDFFDKEYGNSKFNPAGAIALFSSFFISLILSQYVVTCHYYCNGGSLSGLSLFQIDSSATAVIFPSITVATVAGAFLAKRLKLSDTLGVMLMCAFVYILPAKVLLAGLYLGSTEKLQLGSYIAHEFGLIAFYGFFIITYVIFSFYASNRGKN
jgi:hypothetical protein